jgi:hypothetical protein
MADMSVKLALLNQGKKLNQKEFVSRVNKIKIHYMGISVVKRKHLDRL